MKKIVFNILILILAMLSITYMLDYRLYEMYPQVGKIRTGLQLLFYIGIGGYLVVKKMYFTKYDVVLLIIVGLFLIKDLFFILFQVYEISNSMLILEIQFFINTVCLIVLFKGNDIRSLFNIYFYAGIVAICLSIYFEFELINYNTIFLMIVSTFLVNFNKIKFKWLFLIVFVYISEFYGARNVIMLVICYVIFCKIGGEKKGINTMFLFACYGFLCSVIFWSRNFSEWMDELLTRRIFIWKYYLSVMIENPMNIIFGKGLTSRESMLGLGEMFGTFRPYNQHNTYLTFFYEQGLLSYLIVFFIFYNVYKGGGKYYNFYYLMCIYLLEETIHIGDFNITSMLFLTSLLSVMNAHNIKKLECCNQERKLSLAGQKKENIVFRTKNIL